MCHTKEAKRTCPPWLLLLNSETPVFDHGWFTLLTGRLNDSWNIFKKKPYIDSRGGTVNTTVVKILAIFSKPLLGKATENRKGIREAAECVCVCVFVLIFLVVNYGSVSAVGQQ